MSLKKRFPENFSFLQYLLIISILIVAPIMAGVMYDNYANISNEYHYNFEILRTNTEQSIIGTITVVDKGLKIYDEGLDNEMKRGFKPFLRAYNESGGDPSDIELEELKEELGERYNLYIIDKNHTVIYSTVDIDLGLDFSYLKEFSGYLDDVRKGDSYSGDRVVKGIREVNTIRKYAYYPSPDHKYILELSYDIGENSTREILKYGRTVEELKGMNPYLTSVKLYDIFGYTIGNPEDPDTELREFIIKDIIRAKQDVIVEDSVNGTLTDYRFVNLNEDGIASDTSLAIAFTYSTAMLDENIMSAWYMKTLTTIGLSVLLIVILALFCIGVSRPVKNLVEDVDAIAAGNLEHKIRVGKVGREFIQLEKSISNMVGRLRDTINRVQESEELIKKHNEELEEKVASRTKEAQEKTEEANFYLDVITHDINNSNMAALGYAEILADTAGEDDKDLINKVIIAVRQNAGTIKNISIVRTMKNTDSVKLHLVDLDEILRHSTLLFPVKAYYEGTGLNVIADPLLEEVFINIIGNCYRHAGPECEVRISVTESDGNVRVCITDNGPGISDEMKDECFNRSVKNISGRNTSGNGLGLYIVKTLVVDRYGGSVEALDAVEGHPEKGLMICITLKKA
ncbi:MAG: ATP-binding protein [Methanomicrobiaceae archaeon]|nr:ATP-binding protein [Methanomicrobiaceae archaeon]